MNRHQVRQLREARNWTQAQLGKAVGLDGSAISKIESGKKMLRANEADAIAKVFDVGVDEVLGREPNSKQVSGFADEITPYVAGVDDPFVGLQTDHRVLYKVKGNSLDELGVFDGDVVVVDISSAIVAKKEPLRIVWVQYHPDPEADMDVAVSLLRQFVPPSLLVTNSKTENADSINLRTQDAVVMGVVVSVHRALSG